VPGWLLGKLSRRGRRRLGVATLVFAAALTVFLADLIATGHRQAEEQRQRDVALAAKNRERLREDQRPRRAPLATGAAAAPALEHAITRDVRARVRAGLLEGPVKGTRCTPIGGTPAAFNCFTLSRRQTSTRTIVSGYRFSAKADLDAGRLAWCKRNPRPIHPDTGYFVELPVSLDCLP
jgi:hypothetical protein